VIQKDYKRKFQSYVIDFVYMLSNLKSWGLLKPGIGWDRLGSSGTRSQVLAFGTIGSRVPAFDVIAFTDLNISFLPLDSDAVYTVSVRVVPLCFIYRFSCGPLL